MIEKEIVLDNYIDKKKVKVNLSAPCSACSLSFYYLVNDSNPTIYENGSEFEYGISDTSNTYTFVSLDPPQGEQAKIQLRVKAPTSVFKYSGLTSSSFTKTIDADTTSTTIDNKIISTINGTSISFSANPSNTCTITKNADGTYSVTLNNLGTNTSETTSRTITIEFTQSGGSNNKLNATITQRAKAHDYFYYQGQAETTTALTKNVSCDTTSTTISIISYENGRVPLSANSTNVSYVEIASGYNATFTFTENTSTSSTKTNSVSFKQTNGNSKVLKYDVIQAIKPQERVVTGYSYTDNSGQPNKLTISSLTYSEVFASGGSASVTSKPIYVYKKTTLYSDGTQDTPIIVSGYVSAITHTYSANAYTINSGNGTLSGVGSLGTTLKARTKIATTNLSASISVPTTTASTPTITLSGALSCDVYQEENKIISHTYSIDININSSVPYFLANGNTPYNVSSTTYVVNGSQNDIYTSSASAKNDTDIVVQSDSNTAHLLSGTTELTSISATTNNNRYSGNFKVEALNGTTKRAIILTAYCKGDNSVSATCSVWQYPNGEDVKADFSTINCWTATQSGDGYDNQINFVFNWYTHQPFTFEIVQLSTSIFYNSETVNVSFTGYCTPSVDTLTTTVHTTNSMQGLNVGSNVGTCNRIDMSLKDAIQYTITPTEYPTYIIFSYLDTTTEKVNRLLFNKTGLISNS